MAWRNYWESLSLDSDALATFGTAAGKSFAAGSSFHTNAKSVRLSALSLFGFVCE